MCTVANISMQHLYVYVCIDMKDICFKVYSKCVCAAPFACSFYYDFFKRFYFSILLFFVIVVVFLFRKIRIYFEMTHL